MPGPGSRALRQALAALTALVLAGCAHNDVLVFGTDTKLGIDVETGVAQGASPSITIGYKRNEAVWMPLFVNGQGSNYVPCPAEHFPPGRCKAQGSNGTGSPGPELKYQSEQADGSRDAYSVFASLGARIEGNAAKSEASMGLAQFFATGGAAVNITTNKALVTALKVEGPEGAKQQAEAVKSATMSDHASWYAALPPEARAAVDKHEADSRAKQDANLAQLKACATDPTTVPPTLRWPSVVAQMQKSPRYARFGLEPAGKATSFPEIADAIDGDLPLQGRLIEACKVLTFIS